MEIDFESATQGGNNITDTDSLWKVINSLVITIFYDLRNPNTKQTLYSLLESILNRSDTLTPVLVPVLNNKNQDELLQQKYAAFTTWLFGIMFHIVSTPFSSEILGSSIEVQACMLRILSRHQSVMFERISLEYVNILNELVNFYENSSEDEEIILSKFNTEKDFVEGLDLTTFPVTIKSEFVSSVQTAVIKIIIRTNVSSWNQRELWNIVLKIIVKSLPEVKLAALQLCTQMLNSCIVKDKEYAHLIAYSAEIVKTLPAWVSLGQLSVNGVSQFLVVYTEIIQLLPDSLNVTDLCLQIVGVIAYGLTQYNVERAITKPLEETACSKIKRYLTKEPRTCTTVEIEKYISYFTHCPNFITVFMMFVYIDIKCAIPSDLIISATEVSPSWRLLRKKLMSLINAEQFEQSLHILEASCVLQLWLNELNVQVQLYESDLKSIQQLLLQNTNVDRCQEQIVFHNLVKIMAHNESEKDVIQSILLLPFGQSSNKCLEINQRLLQASRRLDTATKIACIEALCKYGNGKERLKLLKYCVSTSETELAVAAVKNSILMQDASIKAEDIVQYVFKPALSSGEEMILRTLAQVLGRLTCLLSGKAKIVRDILKPLNWTVECQYCNENTDANVYCDVCVLPAKYEWLIASFFDLLSSNSNAVRLSISENLLSFINHVESFSSNGTVAKWFPYIKDNNPEIRSNVAAVAGKVLSTKISILKKKGMFLEDNVPNELDQFVDLIISIMADTLLDILNTLNHSMHETLLIAAKNFACVPLHLTEQRVLTIFLTTILHPASSPTAVASATVAYQDIAEFLNITPKALYIRYKQDFLKLIMQFAVRNYFTHSYNIATSVHHVAKCIGYEGSRRLLCRDGQYAVSFLLSYIVEIPEAVVLLRDMADLITVDVKHMLTDSFSYICSHAFLNMTLQNALDCLKLVSNITEISLPVLMKTSFLGIFQKLMQNFHDYPERIIGFLEILSEYDNMEINVNVKEQFALYLDLRLHGVVVNVHSNLSSLSDESTQKSALTSLTVLMRYMGPTYLKPLRYQILGTLRTSLELKRPGFRSLACDAWDAFIHNLAFEDLGPLLPTICVSLMSLSKIYPEKINAMLEFLIVENGSQMSSHISELFFIEDMEVSTHISNIVTAHILQAKPEGFDANLKLWLKRITHETDEVRVRAVAYFQKFLAIHRSELNEMILSNTDVHPLIVELLDTLLMGCQDTNESIRLMYGECIGELGAIEPSLFPRRIVSREDCKFIPDINEEFISQLLLEHVRAFQMQKNSKNMDSFSLAIQEILKIYDISPQGRNCEIWNNLSPTVQQIILPFLTSHFKTTTASNNSEFPHPIYGSEAGSSIETWTYNWLCSMINSIHVETFNNVLSACQLALKRDMRIMIFCLPHVVSFIIANGTEEDHTKLREEMLAVINVREKPVLDSELLRHRPLRYKGNTRSNETRISDETRRTRCSQVVFSILDYLQRWLRERRLNRDTKYKAIKEFSEGLDSLVIAEGCYQSREYHRALMYLEQHMASSGKGLSDSREGGLLAKIYAQLDEPDGVSGILATQNESPTLQQLVLAHEVSGQLQDAATCYERLAQTKEMKHCYLQGMIQCYLGLDQPFTAKRIAEGILSSSPELEPLMDEHEPFWRLSHFDRVDDSSQKNVKRALLDDLKKGVKPNLVLLKQNLVSLLEDSSRPGAYQQRYPYIMKLHVLNEFDKAVSKMLTNMDDMAAILEEWDKRGQLVRASRGVEFVLSMRRATLGLAVELQREKGITSNIELKQEIGKIWLKSAKIARKAGLHQQAYMYILSASDSCPPQQLHIEQAQLYWQKGSQEDAFTTLKRSFLNCFKPSSHYKQLSLDQCIEERKQCAKAKLLFAKYNDETLNVDTDGNIVNYKEAIDVWKGWEKSFVVCAQYYESVVNRWNDEDKDIKGRDLQIHMLNFYGKSLLCGCKYIHQSMPRMLTIWLNYASRCHRLQSGDVRQEYLGRMTKMMEVHRDRLPTFMWLTAFSQLVSRICHPSTLVQNTVCTILVKVIYSYPQHCLWMMASVFNSSYPARQRRCHEILNNSKLKTMEMSKLIRDFNKLWERLIELSNKTIPDGIMNTTISQLSRNLPRLLSNKDFSLIMMPTTKLRQLHLPSKGSSIENHNPFLLEWVHITGIEESVAIMPSLQRPRRITLRGSDGKKYLFMCKPKDDLRRDFRLMEFNDIVNKYLQNDPESRQRRLYIRTYSVVPLNEECGLIEWVPNLVGLRPIIINLYKERGIFTSNRELKAMLCNLKDPLEKKKKMFLEQLLPRHPPVLGDWFRLTFPDPYGWYEARAAYIRTTAVMSMVGYILGLGDRHGENILFDSKCGDCVHVDFNCLFNRGELFDWPERVPFRLTHNMVDAMGPLKIEGPFRRACQVTMRVLRQQSSTLLSVLTPFVYDPLVSWNKNQPGDAGEKTNEMAVEHIKNIEQRLKGLIRSHGKKLENIALNLSVEGQTNHLILEATNIDNLCQMYHGWGAFL